MLRLTIKTSGDSRAFETERTEILVGRRDGADLKLDERAASRNHCLLRVENDGILVIDLGSVNGTLVRGKRVGQAHLRPGEAITIGGTAIVLDSLDTGAPLRLEPERAAQRGAPVAKGTGPDFGRELRDMLKRAPWYMISLIVHVLILMVLDLVTIKQVEGSHGHLTAANAMDLAAPEETPPPELEPDLAEFEPEDPIEELLAPDEASPDPSDPTSNPEFARDLEYQPRTIGTGVSLSARIRPLRIAPKIKNAGESLDKSDLRGEQEQARDAVERGLGRNLRTLRGLPRDRILVVRGDFDKMEDVLKLYRIPHLPVDRARLLNTGPGRARVLCLNCARPPLASRKRKLVTRVKNFVRSGGWVITSDWSLDPYVTVAYPEYVSVYNPSRRQPDTTITVSPAATSPLLEEVFLRRLQTRWWLEETSKFVRVRSSKVNVLVRSEEMQKRYGSDVVVFEFRPGGGRGRVLHLMGHFYQKDGNRSGLVAMHRLILNYLSEQFIKNR